MNEYRINISLLGDHVCKVVLPASTYEREAIVLAKNFAMRFPKHDGFEVSLACWETKGKVVPFITAAT